MKRPAPIPQEVPFEIHELFFSRTDKRGVIESGNGVFVRVSGYSHGELIGRPHNVIRHPDMPKAVFQYFWEVLKSDQPIVAYVKNMAADGRFYWVLAAAFPIDGGYVSIRLKPSTEIFKTVREVYTETLKVEKAQGVECSYAYLFERVRALGFSDYRDLARTALIQELEARAGRVAGGTGALGALAVQALLKQAAGRANQDLLDTVSDAIKANRSASRVYHEVFGRLEKVQEMQIQMQKGLDVIRGSRDTIKFLSFNMAIEAERAGPAGRSLSTIAEGFRGNSDEVHAALASLFASLESMTKRIVGSSFNAAASRFQVEMMEFYCGEIARELSGGEAVAERSADSRAEEIRKEISLFSQMVVSVLGSAYGEQLSLLSELRIACAEIANLREAVNALHFIRQSGRVEIAMLNESGRPFRVHLDEMTKLLDLIGNGIGLIEEATSRLLMEFFGLSAALKSVHDPYSRLVRERVVGGTEVARVSEAL